MPAIDTRSPTLNTTPPSTSDAANTTLSSKYVAVEGGTEGEDEVEGENMPVEEDEGDGKDGEDEVGEAEAAAEVAVDTGSILRCPSVDLLDLLVELFELPLSAELD